MASTEITQQINGTSETVEKASMKSDVVKQVNAVIIDTTKDIQITPNENGVEHGSSTEPKTSNSYTATTNGEATKPPTNTTSEPQANIIENSAGHAVEEPMETDKPAPSVASEEPTYLKSEDTLAPATDAVDTKDSVQTSTEKVEVVELTSAPETVDSKKPTEDDTIDDATDAVVEPSPKKTGRKPSGRKPATPKKTAAPKLATEGADLTADEVVAKEAAQEGHLVEATETPTASKRTPRRKRENAAVSQEGAEEKTPLLEAPLVVEGKRTRQKVERLQSSVLIPEKREVEVPEGSGTKLGDITYIETMITKSSVTDLKLLHRLAFGKAGIAHEVKKNLRLFNGFGFEADSKEYEKKRKILESGTTAELRNTCMILGVDTLDKTVELVDLILNFVVNPADHGKAVSPKRSKSPRKNVGKRKSGQGAKKVSESSAEDDEEEEVDSEPAEEAEPEEVAPAPKRGRKPKAATTSPAAAATTPSKRGASASQTRGSKKSDFPTDADIKTTIKELLKGVNLEEVTMKEMTTKVYDKYPGADLTDKKDFIKDTVKALLSANE